MNPDIEARIRGGIKINKTGRIVDKTQAARAQGDQVLSETITIDLGEKLQEQLQATEKNELESIPRETVLKMFVQAKLEVHFPFKVTKGEGNNYVQAMRQVLSRARKKALKQKTRLDEFRLLTVSIEEKIDHDEVVLVRTKQMSEHEVSVYDDLLAAFEKK